MYSVDYAPVLLVYVMLFAMFAYEYVNVNVPLIHHMSCVHCVSYPMNCTMEIHSIKRISELMELHNKWIVELVLMVMLSVYIYDILDYWWIMRKKIQNILFISMNIDKSEIRKCDELHLLSILFIGWLFA